MRDPAFEYFSDFSVADGDLFNAVNLEGRPMEHLLYRAGCGLENRQCDHLVEAERLGNVTRVPQGESVEGGEAGRLTQVLFFSIAWL